MNSKVWSPSAGGKSIAFCLTGDCASEYEAWTYEDTLKWRASRYGRQAAELESFRRIPALRLTPAQAHEPDSPEAASLERFLIRLDMSEADLAAVARDAARHKLDDETFVPFEKWYPAEREAVLDELGRLIGTTVLGNDQRHTS